MPCFGCEMPAVWLVVVRVFRTAEKDSRWIWCGVIISTVIILCIILYHDTNQYILQLDFLTLVGKNCWTNLRVNGGCCWVNERQKHNGLAQLFRIYNLNGMVAAGKRRREFLISMSCKNKRTLKCKNKKMKLARFEKSIGISCQNIKFLSRKFK